jgi:hypothetical protein
MPDLKPSGISTKTITFLSIAGLALLFVVIYAASAFSYRGDCNRMEQRLKARLESNKSSLATHINIVREMVQVPEMYRDDFAKVIEADMRGRYGASGSGATMQWIKERNLNFDSSLYSKIQTAIEAGRTRFHADQEQLMDIKREYETLLGGNKSVFVAMWFSYPKIDLDQFKVVTNEETDRAFTTGKSEPLKLRQ